MSINYNVKICERNYIKDFIEKWHYSKSINGLHGSYYFALLDNNKIIGAMIYGKLGMANVWTKYGKKEREISPCSFTNCNNTTENE